ncbi:MAG TPA: thiol-disulfide isomerase [Blastocatellia bacterium]|nr:thiol-disulfide isomerase [Blastocatellia bacterium]
MKRVIAVSGLAGCLVVLCLATLSGSQSAGAAGLAGGKEVTFSKDVAPVFYKACVECHKPNDIAPMSLINFKEARPWARSIKEKVLSHEMPPWSPDPKYGEFTNDHRLAQKDIDTIVAWVDQGAKEGNPKDLPPVPEFAAGGWEIGKPDVVLQMAEEHTINPNDPDNYINFFIPTNFKEDVWIQAAEIQPGNKRVVHHVIAFIQSPQMMAKRLEDAKTKGENIGKRTAGGSGLFYLDGNLRRVRMDAPVVDNACEQAAQAGGRRPGGEGGGGGENEGALLAGYAPGMGNTHYPAGVAKRVPAGATLMFQVHYSSFRGKLEHPEKDRTRIGLIFAKQPPENMVITSAAANVMFKIPAGADNHEVVACQVVPRDIEVVNYMPHMHLRGKDMKYEAIYPDGRRETLLSVPKFNFNWQAVYWLKKPVLIPKGTKLIVTAHFDNSTKNKYNPDPKKDVRWGDPTYDEMMIGWMDVMIPLKPKVEPAGKAAGK